jgi:hypothetical protein
MGSELASGFTFGEEACATGECSIRATMDFGNEISPAEVTPVTRSPDSVAVSTTIRRPFLSTMVSAYAGESPAADTSTMNAPKALRRRILLFYVLRRDVGGYGCGGLL